MENIINPRIICAVKYMIRHSLNNCQINGFNLFVREGEVRVYSWAEDAADITPPLVFSAQDFIEKYA